MSHWKRFHAYGDLTSEVGARRFVWVNSENPEFFMVAKQFDATEVPFTLKVWYTKDISRTTKQWSTKESTALPEQWLRAEKRAKLMIHTLRQTTLEFKGEVQ